MTTEQPNAIVSQRIKVTPELIILRIVHQGRGLPGCTARCDSVGIESATWSAIIGFAVMMTLDVAF